jgi:hypothetical protein
MSLIKLSYKKGEAKGREIAGCRAESGIKIDSLLICIDICNI